MLWFKTRMGYIINRYINRLFVYFCYYYRNINKKYFYIFVLIVFNYTSLKNEFHGTIIQLY